jgi:hypothetical protein
MHFPRAVGKQRVAQALGQAPQLRVRTETALDRKPRQRDAVSNLPRCESSLPDQITHHVAGAPLLIERRNAQVDEREQAAGAEQFAASEAWPHFRDAAGEHAREPVLVTEVELHGITRRHPAAFGERHPQAVDGHVETALDDEARRTGQR